MKSKPSPKTPIPLAEQDGTGFRASSDSDDESSDEQHFAASMAHFEQHFDEEVRYYEALSKKRQALEKKRALPKEKTLPEATEPLKGSVNPQSSGEPQVHHRGRAATVRETLRGGLQRLSRASLTHDAMQSLTLTDLASARWICTHRLETDDNGFAVLDNLPPNVTRALAATYRDFFNDKRNSGLQGDERETQLKQALAKKFLALTLMGKDSDFDRSRIGSASAINQYLSRKFSLKIDSVLTSPRNEPSSARTPAVLDDFRDRLVQEAVLRSRNFQVNGSIDLSNLDADPFVKNVYATTIDATRKNESVSKVPGQRTDVTATFQRDFPHSTYEAESDDGSVRSLKSIDEFVAFIGDPLQSGLPAQVSHFACQNTGMLIKNLLYTKTDDKGRPQSMIQLFDGTPIAISVTPKVTYRLKKATDGTITLSYRSEVDTTGAGALGRNTARLLTVNEGKVGDKAVLIEDARAVITLDITFRPDGTARMGTLQLRAEGWNQISD